MPVLARLAAGIPRREMKAVSSSWDTPGRIIRMSQHCEQCAAYHANKHQKSLLDQLGCGVIFLCFGIALAISFFAYGTWVR